MVFLVLVEQSWVNPNFYSARQASSFLRCLCSWRRILSCHHTKRRSLQSCPPIFYGAWYYLYRYFWNGAARIKSVPWSAQAFWCFPWRFRFADFACAVPIPPTAVWWKVWWYPAQSRWGHFQCSFLFLPVAFSTKEWSYSLALVNDTPGRQSLQSNHHQKWPS